MPLLPASEGGSCIDLAEGLTDAQIKADEYAEPQGRFGVDLAARRRQMDSSRTRTQRRFMLHVRMCACTFALYFPMRRWSICSPLLML